jgi:hypothetical protein
MSGVACSILNAVEVVKQPLGDGGEQEDQSSVAYRYVVSMHPSEGNKKLIVNVAFHMPAIAD